MPTMWKLTLEIELTAFQTSRRRKYSTCVCRSDSEEGFLFLPLVKYNICKERDHEKAENGLRAEARPWLDPVGREDSLQRGKSQLAFKCPSLLLSQDSYNNINNKKTFEICLLEDTWYLASPSLCWVRRRKRTDSYFWSIFPLLFRNLSLNNRYKKGYNCSICAMILMKALFCK